jgi:hypothetical protein
MQLTAIARRCTALPRGAALTQLQVTLAVATNTEQPCMCAKQQSGMTNRETIAARF